jgi:hypothetical protein
MSTKFGLILAAVHTLPVSIAFLMILFGSGGYTQPLWEPLLAVDFPALFLLVFVPTLTKGISLNLPLFFGIVGGVWWFIIGWSIAWSQSRLAVSTAKIRFASGFVISIIVILLLLAIQFVADISSYAAGGCIIVGFPVSFFRGCYGTLSLYWPAMTVAKDALAIDATVWLAAASLFSYYLSVRWQPKPGTDSH